MMRLRWTTGARDDLVAICEYIARRDPSNAFRFVAELSDRASVLREQPRCGRVLPEIGDETIRELIHKNYRIIYRIAGQEAHILAVFEGHMLLSKEKLDPGTGE